MAISSHTYNYDYIYCTKNFWSHGMSLVCFCVLSLNKTAIEAITQAHIDPFVAPMGAKGLREGEPVRLS